MVKESAARLWDYMIFQIQEPIYMYKRIYDMTKPPLVIGIPRDGEFGYTHPTLTLILFRLPRTIKQVVGVLKRIHCVLSFVFGMFVL